MLKVFWIQSTDTALLGLVKASVLLSISFKCINKASLSETIHYNFRLLWGYVQCSNESVSTLRLQYDCTSVYFDIWNSSSTGYLVLNLLFIPGLEVLLHFSPKGLVNWKIKVVGKAQATKSNLHNFWFWCLVVALIDVSEVLAKTLHDCMTYERKEKRKFVWSSKYNCLIDVPNCNCCSGKRYDRGLLDVRGSPYASKCEVRGKWVSTCSALLIQRKC